MLIKYFFFNIMYLCYEFFLRFSNDYIFIVFNFKFRCFKLFDPKLFLQITLKI